MSGKPVDDRTWRDLGGRYWRLWAAVASSNFGDGLAMLALPWLASLLTRDPLAVAGVAMASRLPWLVFSLQAGVLGDRLDRRRLLVTANSVRALVAGAVAVAVALDVMTVPGLYLTAFALGMCEVVFDNTSQSILPSLVPRDRLERANGNLMGAQMVVQDFVALPVGGALIGVAIAVPFGIDAATAALSAALVATIPGTYRAVDTAAATGAAEPPRVRLRTQVAQGMAWLWQHRLLRTLAVTLGIMNAVSASVLATHVLFAQEILGLDGFGFGLLLMAGSVGALLGSLLAPSITRRVGAGPSMGSMMVLPAVAFGVTALSSNALVVGAAIAVFSFSAVMWNVVTVSLRQELIPDHLLSRVNSVYRFFGWGMMPVGTLLGGMLVRVVEDLLGRAVGLRSPFAVGALVYLGVFVVAAPTLTSRAVADAREAAEHA
jgi:MFS family permease